MSDALIAVLARHTAALEANTAALAANTQANAMLAEALMAGEDLEEAPAPLLYLDGSAMDHQPAAARGQCLDED